MDDTPWADGELFRPPTYIEWQMDMAGQAFALGSALMVADTGLGKSMMALADAGIAMEDRLIDHVLVVCKPNKLGEWHRDFSRHTRIPALVYDGAKRQRNLGSLPAAIIVTYETCRNDIAVFPPQGSRARALAPGPLMAALRGRRVMVVYDEVAKLGRRTSRLYKAHYWMIAQFRKEHPGTRVIGLSATPMDTDLENFFSVMRVVVPGMSAVKDFEENVIRSRDPMYGRPRYTANGREWLRERTAPWVLRKRRSDPDVRDQFPELTERFRRIRMRPDQARAYHALAALREQPGEEVPGLSVLLRQLAGDPLAVLEAARAGSSPLAVMVAEEMGAELEKCSSAKAAELEELAAEVTGWGGKLMAFTFYGQTVLPVLQRRLAAFEPFACHGGMTSAERDRQLASFRSASGPAVLLASDAAADGINVPEVDVVDEYDIGRTHAIRVQRSGRGNRLGRAKPLTFITYVLEGTLEADSSVRTVLARNADMDFMLGDAGAGGGYVTAADRREMYARTGVTG